MSQWINQHCTPWKHKVLVKGQTFRFWKDYAASDLLSRDLTLILGIENCTLNLMLFDSRLKQETTEMTEHGPQDVRHPKASRHCCWCASLLSLSLSLHTFTLICHVLMTPHWLTRNNLTSCSTQKEDALKLGTILMHLKSHPQTTVVDVI